MKIIENLTSIFPSRRRSCQFWLRGQGVHFCDRISLRFFCQFTWFLHIFFKQCNTGNCKSDRILTRSGTSNDGVSFLPLGDRDPYFFVLIFRWFCLHFNVILHDFGHPSRSLFKVYEWSAERIKMRNFHHVFMRFWHCKNRGSGDVWWISWKISLKLGRNNSIHFRAICRPWNDFFMFLPDLEKNAFKKAKRCQEYCNFEIF